MISNVKLKGVANFYFTNKKNIWSYITPLFVFILIMIEKQFQPKMEHFIS